MRERAKRPSDVVHEVREANHGSSNEIQMERLLLYPFCSVCILVNAYKLVQQTIPHKQFPSTPLGLLVAHPRSVWNAYQFLEGTSYLASIALHPEQFPAVLLSVCVCLNSSNACWLWRISAKKSLRRGIVKCWTFCSACSLRIIDPRCSTLTRIRSSVRITICFAIE